MIKAKWTKLHFLDAFNFVEDNCKFYPPKHSEFMNYDKVVRFNTYQEVSTKIGLYIAVYSKGTNEPVYVTKQEKFGSKCGAYLFSVTAFLS